jgi:hypothetical protein
VQAHLLSSTTVGPWHPSSHIDNMKP